MSWKTMTWKVKINGAVYAWFLLKDDAIAWADARQKEFAAKGATDTVVIAPHV